MADNGSKQQFSNRTITIKLDETNFLQWKQQVRLIIIGHGLQSYLDGTPPPPQFIAGPDGSPISNPAYTEYTQVDASLSSWILSSISSPLLPNLVNCNSAREIWLALQPKSSTTTVMRLINSLNSQKKGNLTMRDYIAKIQNLCDNLASAAPEHKLTETLQIGMILGGLGSEYESAITLIAGSLTPYSLSAATNVLLDAEVRMTEALGQFGATALNTSVPGSSNGVSASRSSAHMPQNSTTFGSEGQQSYPVYQYPPQRGPSTYQRGPTAYAPHAPRFPGNNQRAASYPQNRQVHQMVNQGQRPQSYGRGQGRGYNSNRTQCQICGKLGHMAGRCWFRWDHAYGGVGSNPNGDMNEVYFGDMSEGILGASSANVNSAEIQTNPQTNQNISQPQVHTPPADSQFYQIISPATHPHLYGPQVNNTSASGASTSSQSDQASSSTWYPDSGATHHLTNSVNNMTQSSSYNGAGPSNRGESSGGN